MKNLVLLIFVLIVFGCHDKDYDSRTIRFDNFRTTEVDLNFVSESNNYTFLEYTNESIIGRILNYKITKKYILIVDQQQKLFVFKKDGSFFSQIYNKGKGPSEYLSIEDFTIDVNEEIITILDPITGKIIRFNIYGKYINEFPITYNHAAHIFSINNFYYIYQSSRFSSNNYYIFMLNNLFQPIDSVKDMGCGSYLKKLPYLMSINCYYYDNNICFKEVLSDTIFRINDKNNYEIHYIIDFGKKRMPNYLFTKTEYFQKESHKFYQLAKILESDNYVFFYIKHHNENVYFIYVKNSFELFKLRDGFLFTNRDYHIKFWPDYIDQNEIMYSFIDANVFYQNYKNLSISNKYQINLNDNPILLSFKLSNINLFDNLSSKNEK